jgi:hypothetical protein
MEKSYAQFGEDLLVKEALEYLKIEEPIRYLDIGVSDPIIFNNIYFFYERKSRGVLVEPVPGYIARIKEIRPEDLLIDGVVGLNNEPQAVVRIIGGHGGGSRIVKDKLAAGRRFIITNQYRINNVLLSHFFYEPPQFLSIDIEGYDLDILKEINYERFKILIICAETRGRMVVEVTNFMESKGYKKFKNTQDNTVFIMELKNGT